MTHAADRLQRWRRLELTLISKTILAWLVATLIFLFFVGALGWAEWLTFTAAVFGIIGYKELKGHNDDAPPRVSYPDGDP